jgi:predicted NACHT family NTPase
MGQRSAFTYLVAIAFPATTTALAYAQTKDPERAFRICLATVVLEAGLGFLAKVWQRLEVKWADRLADWVDRHVTAMFAGHRRRYLEHLVQRHRTLDVKGLTTQGIFALDLPQVFVQLDVDPAPLREISVSPLQDGRPAGTGRTIWELLGSPLLAGQHFAVLGPPGCGKTTLLKHVALVLAGPRRRRPRGAGTKIPIFLSIRDVAAAVGASPDVSLARLACDLLARWDAPPPPAGWLEDQLEGGRCLVLLDGLDEVADPALRGTVVSWIERRTAAHGRNRFLISSRPLGFAANPVAGTTVLRVCPLGSKQIEDFVRSWYLANERMATQREDAGVQEVARDGADDLLARFRRSEALHSLAVNPLLLTMMANVHRYRSALPGRRVELYAEICEVFLGKRQEAHGMTFDLTPAQKQRVLQPLAWALMCQHRRDVERAEAEQLIVGALRSVSPGSTCRDFLDHVESASGLLVELERDRFGFAHLSFQEYLSAAHAREQRLEAAVIERMGEMWWREAIRLYCALGDASAIVQACLASGRPTASALALAMECLDEAREVDPDVRGRFQRTVEDLARDEEPELRRTAAEAMLARRIRA